MFIKIAEMKALDGIYLKGLVEESVKVTQGWKFQKKGQILIFRYSIYRSNFLSKWPSWPDFSEKKHFEKKFRTFLKQIKK